MENSVADTSSDNDEQCCANSDDIMTAEPMQEIVIVDQGSEAGSGECESEVQQAGCSSGSISSSSSRGWQCALTLSTQHVRSVLSSSDESTPRSNKISLEEGGQGGSGEAVTECKAATVKVGKKTVRKKYGSGKVEDEESCVEDSAQDVRKRFDLGCECADSCFRGLNPEAVYRHRLNIAELTKEEHDMYLMGVTMACMSDPVSTNKRRERLRARTNYAYSGRKVCLSAFLFLENLTLYQLKMIRKHVMTHGVTARIHGNHGKKPHNVFPLDIYRRATTFLKDYIQQHSISGNAKGPVMFPPDVTRKSLHNTYKDYVCSLSTPDEKILGYSTFRHFIKEQFPSLRFSKTESGSTSGNTLKSAVAKQVVKNATVEESKESSGGVALKQEMPAASIQVAQIPVFLLLNR